MAGLEEVPPTGDTPLRRPPSRTRTERTTEEPATPYPSLGAPGDRHAALAAAGRAFVLVIACGGRSLALPQCHPDMLPPRSRPPLTDRSCPHHLQMACAVVGNLAPRTYAETLDPHPGRAGAAGIGASPDLVVCVRLHGHMTITDAAGESIYDGSATGFRSYRLLRTAPTMPSDRRHKASTPADGRP